MTSGLSQKKNGKSWIAPAFALIFAMLLLFILNTKITVYSDDYWYGTFYNDGFVAFLKNMYTHYMETNGRFYIHLIIPTVLLFGTRLFAVLSPILLAFLYYFGARTLNDKLTKKDAVISASLGILLTLAANVMYLRMTLLWISAYFNYVFPLCMVLASTFFQIRYYRKEQSKGELFWGLLFSLLAGASTEQCGIAALVMSFGGEVINIIFYKTDKKKSFLYPFVVLLGFLTILLAPGSWARVDRGVDGGILSCLVPSVFAKRFIDAMIYVVKYPSSIVLLCAVDILSALLCFFNKNIKKTMYAGVLFALLQVICFVLKLDNAACALAFLSMLYIAAHLICYREYAYTGLMILVHIATNMMLIITTLGSERTAFAGYEALIVTSVSLGMRLLKNVKLKKIFVIFIMICCVAQYIPTLRGYSIAKGTVDKNIEQTKLCTETGVCVIDTDINAKYRFTMPFEGSYFYDNFRKYYNIPDDVKMVFTSNHWKMSDIISDTGRYEFPALENENGLFVPVEFVIAAAGGNAVWSWKNHTYDIEIGGKHYTACESGEIYLNDTLIGNDFEVVLPYSQTYTLLYTRADKLWEYMGIGCKLDEELGAYRVYYHEKN